MKKISIIILSVVVVFLVNISLATAEKGNSCASSTFNFFGSDGKEYTITSTSEKSESEQSVLSATLSHFETIEEAKNALLIVFREALRESIGNLVDSSAFYTKYIQGNGRLHLSLNESFMRTPKGEILHADTGAFFKLALVPQKN